jgi:hypothetical protein
MHVDITSYQPFLAESHLPVVDFFHSRTYAMAETWHTGTVIDIFLFIIFFI